MHCFHKPFRHGGLAFSLKTLIMEAAFPKEVFDMDLMNETMMQYFEWDLPDDGLLWRRVAAQAGALREMGITHIWLPPAYKGNSSADVGYGVYDMYDLGEFDQKGTVRTKYGTREEYLHAVEALQREHIKVYADIVLGHKLGGDEKETVMAIEDDAEDRTKPISEPFPIEAWSRFTFPGRAGMYSGFTWDHTHFSGTDYDAKSGRSGIFRFADKQWNTETDPEHGNFDYLMGMDVDTRNPIVRREIVRWLKWYYNTVHMDGLRLDAVKHISFQDMCDMLTRFRANVGAEVPAVGEYWSDDLGRLTHYLDQVGHCMKLFDAPLHYSFCRASNEGASFDMRTILDNSLVKALPDEAVTFVDNHDTQPGQALESFVQAWFKPIAYALILLRGEGLPCVFYGDQYGIPSARVEPVAELDTFLHIRRRFAYGETRDYFDDPNIVGFVRAGVPDRPNSGIAVLLSNAASGSKRMFMGKEFAGQTFYDLTGKCVAPVTVDEEGWGEFGVASGSAAVWGARGAYERMRIRG